VSANETVKAFGQERNKLGALWCNTSHNLEHYGNLVVYMRLKGCVPPPVSPSLNKGNALSARGRFRIAGPPGF